MTENVLFLIHGVGYQKTGWSTDVCQFLADELRLYPTFRGETKPFSGRLHCEEIVYNDIFDEILGGWGKLTEQFDSVKDELMPGALDSINGFLGQMAANGSQKRNNQIANRAGDALLYRGLHLVQRLVLLKVIQQIASVVTAKSSSGPVQFGVLGHSLGTAVAHDALQAMATTKWLTTPSGKLKTFKGIEPSKVQEVLDSLGPLSLGAGNLRFKAVYMVSNTSPLLFTTVDPHRSVVRPPFGSIAGITDKYVNINHICDPIGMVRPMRLSSWPRARKLDTAFDLNPEHIHQLNIHDLQHYLADPQVHGHIFLDLIDDFTAEDYAYALLRKDPQTSLVSHPFPKYKINFDRDETRNGLAMRMKDEVLPELLAALNIVDAKIRTA